MGKACLERSNIPEQTYKVSNKLGPESRDHLPATKTNYKHIRSSRSGTHLETIYSSTNTLSTEGASIDRYIPVHHLISRLSADVGGFEDANGGV